MMPRLPLSSGAVIVALLCAGTIAHADDAPPAPSNRSLLFNSADASAIARAIGDYERSKKVGVPVVADDQAPPPAVPNIFVSALAYYGEGEWTVWANGYKIVPGRQAPDFSVVSVSADKVEIVVAGDSPARFTLQPYQTWRSRSRDVVEGIVP